MRSMRSTRSFLNESSIWAMPLLRPDVQTLVAMNSFDRMPSVSITSPATCSDGPYIGDESITRAPSVTNSRSTSASGGRCHVPRPMTGICSPEEGMGRVITDAS